MVNIIMYFSSKNGERMHFRSALNKDYTAWDTLLSISTSMNDTSLQHPSNGTVTDSVEWLVQG